LYFAFILTVIFTNNRINEKVYIYKNLLIHGNEKEQKNEQKIKELENELHKLQVTKSVIKEHILAKNSRISTKTAELYACTIMKESSKRGNSPFVQTALIGSESSFMTNPKHDISGVVGMSGIYWDVWKTQLKQQGIAYKKSDLENPITNIRASSYILAIYMNQTNNKTVKALAHYKGYCTLGKNQALNVMKIAQKLKMEEKQLC